MRKQFLALAAGLLLLTPCLASAFPGDSDVTALSNKDVLLMVQNHLSEDAIIKAIKSSPCTFDTFPPVLKDMKRRGVSDAVLQAMIAAPYGPSQKSVSTDDLANQPIYHYADQLKQLGYIAPTQVGRGSSFRRQSVRARNNTRMRQP